MRVVAWLLLLPVVCLGFAAPAAAERRVALVVGNAAYRHAPALATPRNDAEGVAAALRRLGFEVLHGADLDRAAMEKLLQQFAEAIDKADAALVFYAGHGLQVSGRNYLIPVDAKLEKESDLVFQAIGADVVRQLIEKSQRTNIVILDASRDNPLARTLARSMGARAAAIGRGLAQARGAPGTLIVYATQPDSVALEGDGKHSPFTAAFLANVEASGIEVRQALARVRQAVVERTKGRQVPWESSSLTGDFYFAGAPSSQAPGADGKPSTPADRAPPADMVLTGKWSGVATAGQRSFRYQWDIEQQGAQLRGTIRIATQDETHYALYSIEGTVTGATVTFRGTGFIANTAPAGDSFCMAAGTLTYSKTQDSAKLEGTWGPNPVAGGCPTGSSGQVTLAREAVAPGGRPDVERKDDGEEAKRRAEEERRGREAEEARRQEQARREEEKRRAQEAEQARRQEQARREEEQRRAREAEEARRREQARREEQERRQRELQLGMSGRWTGTYMDCSSCGGPVRFTLTITAPGRSFRGRIVEPNTFGNRSSRTLAANVFGQIQDRQIRFTKVYDGTGGQSHAVQYVGTLGADMRSASGRWSIGSTTGRFVLRKQ